MLVPHAAVVAFPGPELVEVHVVSAPALVAVLKAVHDSIPRPAELLAELKIESSRGIIDAGGGGRLQEQQREASRERARGANNPSQQNISDHRNTPGPSQNINNESNKNRPTPRQKMHR